jgi:serine/threonine protein kinase
MASEANDVGPAEIAQQVASSLDDTEPAAGMPKLRPRSARPAVPSNFDAYISCRYACDGPFAMILYDGLQKKNVSSFWFTDVVRPGSNMMERTVSSLMKTTVFVPVMSSQMFASIRDDTATDYVLAEWLAALIFYKARTHLHTVRLRKICPVLIKKEDGTTILASREDFPLTLPTQTIDNVLDVFDRLYFNLNEAFKDRVSKWTYRDIFDEMAMHYAVEASAADSAAVVERLHSVVNTANKRISAAATSPSQYHAFISYRGPHHQDLGPLEDGPIVTSIVDTASTQKLGEQSFSIYSDMHCLDIGDNYLETAIEGIKNSTVFVPVVSMGAVKPMLDHEPGRLDLLVAEWICALLFWHIPSCRLRSILPLISRNSQEPDYQAYFEVRSQISNKIPSRTIQAVLEAFDRLQIVVEPKLSAKVCSWTVHEILNRLMENMGVDCNHAEPDWAETFVDDLMSVLDDLPGDRFINPAPTASMDASASTEFKCNTVNVDVLESPLNRVVKAQFLDATNTNVQCFVKHALSPVESKYIDDELSILKTLNGTGSSEKHCVKVFGFGVNYANTAEYKYFVMEAFGKDLSVILDGTCPKLSAYSLALKIVDCVRSVHSVQIMHGDLKPKNILYKHNGKDYRVKLCDFDSARRFGELFPFEELAFKCTPAYMCPELCRDSQYYVRPGVLKASAQPDYFSLGLILWQLFSSGSPASPIENMDLAQLLHDENSWESKISNIEHCPGMAAVIVKLCKPKPSERQLEYRAVKEWLDGATKLTEKNEHYREALALTATNANAAVSNILNTQLKAYFLENYGVLERMCSEVKTHNANLLDAVGNQQQGSAVTIITALQQVLTETSAQNEGFQNLRVEFDKFTSEIERNSAGLDEKLEKMVSVAVNLQSGMEDVLKLVNEVKNDLSDFSEFTRENAVSSERVLAKLEHEISETVREEARAIISEVKRGESASKLRLNTLLKGNFLVPTLFVVIPDISPNGSLLERFNPTNWVKDKFRFYFVCAHTLQIVCCGPDGTGYRFDALKQWVAKAAPVLLAGLCLLQLAMTASGIPIPIPGISHLYKATQSNHTEACQKLLSDTARYIQKFKTNYGGVVDGVQGTIQNEADTDPANLARSVDTAPIPMADVTAEESRAAYGEVRDLMEKYDSKLQYTGLRFVIDDSGVSQWIADTDTVEQSFRINHGKRKPVAASAANEANFPTPGKNSSSATSSFSTFSPPPPAKK